MRKLLTLLFVAVFATASFAVDFPAAEVVVGTTKYTASYIAGTTVKPATAPLYYGGIGSTAPTDGSWSGKVVLLDRGVNSFVQKMNIAKTAGAVGVIVANNAAGAYTASLGTSSSTLPGVTVSQQDGAKLRLVVGQNVTVATPGSVTPPVTPPSVVQNGLSGVYYNTKDFTGPVIKTQIDPTIDFDWYLSSPNVAGIDVDNFSIRWTGYVKPQFSENYTFIATCDDGVRLWVNNVLIVDRWSDSAAADTSGSIALVAGQSYPIVMEYYEGGAFASAKLSWSSASQAREIIPTNALFASSWNTPPVTPSAPVITAQPNSGSVLAGLPATLSVTVSGTGPISYQWRKNGVAIAGATLATYTIPVTQSTDAGSYSVIASISGGAYSVTSLPATLTVTTLPTPPPNIPAPPITRIATKVVVGIIPDNVVNLMVEADGTPPITFQWKLNGVNIAGKTNSLLVLSGPTLIAGSYTVTASNEVGSAESAAYELVIKQP